MSEFIDLPRDHSSHGLSHQDPRTFARVLVCDGPLVLSPGPLNDPLARKRQAVWYNDPRNSLLADVATSFAIRKIDRLWEHDLPLDLAELPHPAP